MKLLPLVLVLLLTACDIDRNYSSQYLLTYEQLASYPKSCEKASVQKEELRILSDLKNFKDAPEELSEGDRKYNTKLKDTIWWYSYNCEQS